MDDFFSWTEHIFIHLAILMGKVRTGDDVATLAKAEWAEKYKAVFDISDPPSKKFYDDLVMLRRQVRNFVAHGYDVDGDRMLRSFMRPVHSTCVHWRTARCSSCLKANQQTAILTINIKTSAGALPNLPSMVRWFPQMWDVAPVGQLKRNVASLLRTRSWTWRVTLSC